MQRKDGKYRVGSIQVTIREQVVDYVKKKIGTQKQVAEIFGLHIRLSTGYGQDIKKEAQGILKSGSTEFGREDYRKTGDRSSQADKR